LAGLRNPIACTQVPEEKSFSVSNAMRITIVTGPWLPVPALQGGSVPRMWDGLAQQFAARGHQVVIMARAFPGQPARESRNGVRYQRRGGFAQGRSIYLDLAKDLIYAVDLTWRLPSADILVTNDFWLPILAGWFRRSAGLIVISANRFPKRQYKLYQHAASVVASSRAIERAIIEQTPTIGSQVRTIPNPLDTSTFVPPADGRSTGKKILYVGRLHPEKGVDVLVRAFGHIHEKHPGLSLRIVGPSEPSQGGGGQGYLLELRQLADGLPVTFSEPEFDVARLAAIYQDADLFCYPSLAEKGEALGVAPLEAMSAGLPVIVSGLECFLDFIVDGETGLRFDHRTGNPSAALAAKLDQAIGDWSRSLEIGRRGRDAAQRFAFDPVAGEFLASFEELSRKAAPRAKR
jgi:glycosyltransferase involved in cell wall biosynthesis